MLSARNVIAVVLLLVFVSAAGVMLKFARPPDSGGLGRDSYGTRAHGHRAILEILGELGVTAERGLVPPGGGLAETGGDGVCMVFWSPNPGLVSLESGYLRKVAEWVELGGWVVVAPARASGLCVSRRAGPVRGAPPRGGRRLGARLRRDTSILAELGLPGVTIVELGEPEDEGADEDEGEREAQGREDWGPREIDKLFYQEGENERSWAFRTVEVSAEGELAPLGELVSSLRVPECGLRVMGSSSLPRPDGRVFFRAWQGGSPAPAPPVSTADGTRRRQAVRSPSRRILKPPDRADTYQADGEHDIISLYHVGDGTVIVVSEPELFRNRSIAEDDNSVLAVHLLALSGRGPLFDEFYHGLTIRGNPMWLATRHPYGMFLALVVLAAALWVWRESVELGPAVGAAPPARRSIGEYVEAMARLFDRSGHQRFTLREARDGVLWALRKRLRLGPRQETADGVARALARRDEDASKRLRSAVARIDSLLEGKGRLDRRAAVDAAREMTGCL